MIIKYSPVYDFGRSREKLREKVPLEKRIKRNSKNIIHLEFVYPEIKNLMTKITEINRKHLPINSSARFLYQKTLFAVYKRIIPEVMRRSPDKTIFFPPKNGGALIIEFFKAYAKGKIKNIVDYELKRLLTTDGSLMVCLKEKVFYPKGEFHTAAIIDDCLASDVSVWASMDIIKTQYPRIRNLIVAVSAATQRGMKQTYQEAKNYFNFDKVTLISAIPVYEMTENYYLLKTEEEGYNKGVYAVGDMGAWAKSLPKSFNKKAVWNRQRI